MKLIIEGTDLSGKTTIIEKIGKFYNTGFTLKNNFKPKNKLNSAEIYNHYWHIINLLEEEDFVILDRFFPSQAVYSYMRGLDELSFSQIIELDEYASTHNYLYVYVDTPLPILLERYRDRGDEHITEKDLEVLRQRYEKFFFQTKMPKLRLISLDVNWFEQLKEFIKEEENGNI